MAAAEPMSSEWKLCLFNFPTLMPQTLQLDGNSLSGSLPDFWGGTGCQQMR